MNKNKLSYKEAACLFLLLIVFVVSVSVAILSKRTDSVEARVDVIEKSIK